MSGASRTVASEAVHIAEIMTHRTHPTSGVLGAVVELSVALAETGARVDLWVPRAWPRDDDRSVEELAAAGVSVQIVPASSLWEAAARVAEAVNRSGCDVAHLHNGFSPMNNLVARRLQVPYLVTTHGVYASEALDHHRWRKQAAIAMTERMLLRRAASVTALTTVERDELAVIAPGVEARVVPLGFSDPSEDAQRTGIDVRDELGLPVGAPLAVYGGRMDVRAKRLDQMVEGVASTPGWHGVLIGADFDGGRARLDELRRRHRAADRIHLLDYRLGRAYRAVLSSGDVNVLMSMSEGLPRGVIEGMLEGVPAIVSPEVERRIGVAERGSGWIARPGHLGEVLREVQGMDAVARAAKREAARDHGSAYLWPAVIPVWQEVLNQAARPIE